MCDAPSTWRARMCAIDCRPRSAAYSGLIAAPGTPNACVTPSRSITSTAAIAAFIFAIVVSVAIGVGRMVGDDALALKTVDKHDAYSTMECMDRLQAVRLFVRVVELGSFRQAAAE